MADCIYEVKRERFHLNQNNKYILQGRGPKESKAEAYLDHEPVEVIIEEQTDIGAMERFKDKDRIDACLLYTSYNDVFIMHCVCFVGLFFNSICMEYSGGFRLCERSKYIFKFY